MRRADRVRHVALEHRADPVRRVMDGVAFGHALWERSAVRVRCGPCVEDLARIVGAANVLPGDDPRYVADQTAFSAVHGVADAVVLPGDAEEVAAVVAVVPRARRAGRPARRGHGLGGRRGAARLRRRPRRSSG